MEYGVVGDLKQRLDRTAIAFLTVGGVAVAGTMVGLLGSTSAITLAADGESGGVTTGLFLAVMLLFTGLAAPRAGVLAGRFGARRVFAGAQVCIAVSWFVVGLLVILVEADTAVLLAAAPIFGLFSGITAVLTPVITRAYLDGRNLAAAFSRRSALSGIGAAAGALIGGYLITASDPGVGILANGLLTVPLAAFAICVRATAPVRQLPTQSTPWRNMTGALRRNRQLRQTVIVVIAVQLFVAPMLTMIVPILDDLGQSSVSTGSGIVLAGVAIGRLLTPRVVDLLQKDRSDLWGSLLALSGAAGLMAVFGVSAPVASTGEGQWSLALIGIGLGATRFASRSLTLGSAANALGPGRGTEGLAAVVTIGGFVATVGVLAWGAMIQFTSSPITIWAGAVGLLLVVIAMAPRVRQVAA